MENLIIVNYNLAYNLKLTKLIFDLFHLNVLNDILFIRII